MSQESKTPEYIGMPIDAIFSLYNQNHLLVDYTANTFLISEHLLAFLDQYGLPYIDKKVDKQICQNWCVEGIEAKVLIPGEKWQKGKVRLTMEFCPDLPESPAEADQDEETSAGEDPIIDPENPGSLLDDIRQTLLQQDAE